MPQVTVVIADDHPVVREGVRSLLASSQRYHVVGEAADGLATVQLVSELQPDILIVDLAMPGLGGAELVRRSHLASPDTRIIVLSMHTDEDQVRGTIQAGAMAYVSKGAGIRELSEALLAVREGRGYVSRELSLRAQAVFVETGHQGNFGRADLLTSREREILQLVAEGHTNRDIAAVLGISQRTVEIHRANMMHKLGLKGVPEVVKYALQHGFVDLGQVGEASHRRRRHRGKEKPRA